MLQSLEIHNYRNLRHLTIERLGRVNLLLGKNNTGKTSVLEAIAIHVNRGSVAHLLQLLSERGENYIQREFQGINEINDIIRTLSALFIDRPPVPFYKLISIGDPLSYLTELAFVWYSDSNGQSGNERHIYAPGEPVDSGATVGFRVKSIGSFFCPIQAVANFARGQKPLSVFLGDDSIPACQFIRTQHIDRDSNGLLWDKIALTESEDEVVNALKIIEPDIDRITFRNERERERVAVVKLKSSNDVVPLSSMGDGINRILTIILAMVNCENGYLLIDEFENDLHYSVQEQLWEVVFTVAERLNIQVFATTHSYDCIDAFSTVLNSGRHAKESGCMIRLDNYEGTIEATLYDADEIETTTRVHVDPR
ncbi:MAG: AAA family ATPase [Rudanella sp.]|nr:AAA family ATPase [Rudanella sp.]